MIDEKKIEEAAEEQLEKLGAYGLDEVDLGKEQQVTLYREEDVKAMFMAGINWFLGNLWHDVSEEPAVGKEYLLKAVFQNYNGEIFEGYVTSTFGVDGWKEDFFLRNFDIEVKKWACIEDLMKGGM